MRRFVAPLIALVCACGEPEPPPRPSAEALTESPQPALTRTTECHVLIARDAGPGDGGPADGGTSPLARWMFTHTAKAITEGDFPGLERALGALAGVAPKGYANWASIAKDGADAARVRDLEAVRAACRGCHLSHRTKYRRERPAHPLP